MKQQLSNAIFCLASLAYYAGVVVVMLLLVGTPNTVCRATGANSNPLAGHDYALNLNNIRHASMGIRRSAERLKNSVPMPSQNGATDGGGVAEAQQQFELFTGPTPTLPPFDDEEEQQEDEVLHIHGMERQQQQQQQKQKDGGVVGTAPTSVVVAPIEDDDGLALSRQQQQQQHQHSAQHHRGAQSDADPGPPYASAPTLCPADEHPTFLRHLWLPEEPDGTSRTANFVRKMDSLEACARLCRDNVEPFGGRHFACHGFTYIGQRNDARNACEFFDDHLAAALEKKPLLDELPQRGGRLRAEDMAPQFPKNYFERICLGLPSRCARLPFAFDVHPRRALRIPSAEARPLGVEQVDDRKQCLQQCLITKGCRSLDFDTANLTCMLYAHSLHTALGAPEESTWPLGQLVENVDLDHYENTCLTALDRCGTRHLAFILIRNAELVGFSVGLGKMSISECLSRCLDSPPAFCRAVQFRAPANECFLGTERPFAPLPSDELDIFEPVCLPDPPRTSILECHGEHVFERVPNMELRMDDSDDDASIVGGMAQPNNMPDQLLGTDMPGLTLERCLDACILDESCVSLIFRPFAADEEQRNGTATGTLSMCRLFPVGRTDNRTLSVIHPNVDYFELSCNRMPLPSAMRRMFTMPPAPHLPQADLEQPEQRHKDMTTTMTSRTTTKEQHHQQTDQKWTTAGPGNNAPVAAANVWLTNGTNAARTSAAKATTVAEEVPSPPLSQNVGTPGMPSSTASVSPPVPTPHTFLLGRTDMAPQASGSSSSTAATPSIILSDDDGTMMAVHATSRSSATAGGGPSPIPSTLSSHRQSECSAPMLHSVLLERGRTLRLEQAQQHHRNVLDALHCERLCADNNTTVVALRCRTFAYSHRSRDCLLSSAMINGRAAPEFELFSQEGNPDVELYTFVAQQVPASCGGSKWSSPMTTTTNPTMATANEIFGTDERLRRPFAGTNLPADAGQATPFMGTNTHQKHTTEMMEKAMSEFGQAVAATQPPPEIVPPTAKIVTILSTAAENSTTTTTKTTTTTNAVVESDDVHQQQLLFVSTPAAWSGIGRPSSTPSSTATTAPPSSSSTSNNIIATHGNNISSSWMAPFPVSSMDGSVEPPLMVVPPAGNGAGAGRLSVEQIRAGVICDPQGLNVTFRLVGRASLRYTGVVYAADRFAHCRLFVEEAAEFAFYVNRPGVGQSNWCNSVETNEELNVVLVMSNDEVFPLDVTTSDDFFFHVSCDYRGISGGTPTASASAGGLPQRHRLSAWPGTVSGPEPGPLFASAARRPQKVAQLQQRRPLAEPETGQRRERVHLKILRDGRPVSSVYIGERLSAVVESNDVEVERLRVADCNATRVGGRVPRPSSIPLLDRAGCSLNPHIIGHMRRYANRLEAPLSAFRIDGSDQIDIVCAVFVCRARCAGRENQCSVELDHHTSAINALRVHRASAAGAKTMPKERLADLPPSVAGDFLTVDQRIRVLVSEEEENEKQLAAEDAEAIDERQLLRSGGNAALPASVGDGPTGAAGPTDILLGGMASTAASGDLCLNPVALLFLMLLLLLTVASLIISLLVHWCHRKGGRRSSHNFYPAASTELSSHHFHIPRVLDRRASSYMG